jgi:hypothetical protein
MISYPVVFGYRDVIKGRGFFAGVVTDGQALLTIEDDGGHWLFGVNPGGVAGGGKETAEAAREFKKSYLSVLFDIAEEAHTFQEFKAEVERFFHETNEPTEAEWKRAHVEVKKGALNNPNLPRVDVDKRPSSIQIIELQGDETAPRDVNVFDAPLCEAA